MKFTVYQINMDRDKARVKFQCYERTLQEVPEIRMEIYDKVYEGEIQRQEEETEKTLEAIYGELNLRKDRHPKFKGHSLSVSDVVELKGERWFCDTVGWKKLGS